MSRDELLIAEARRVSARAEEYKRKGLNGLAAQAYDQAAGLLPPGGLRTLYKQRAIVERSLVCRR